MQTGQHGETYNAAFQPGFAGYNETFVAELCADPVYFSSCAHVCPNPSMIVGWSEWVGAYTCGEICDGLYVEKGQKEEGMPDSRLMRIGYDAEGRWQNSYPIETIRQWCRGCVLNDGSVDPLTTYGRIEDSVAAMGAFDWIALMFCSVFMGLKVAGELKDIELCTISMQRKSDTVALPYRIGLVVVTLLRRWLFLSAITVCVPLLVIFKGGDGLTVCFNTIAIIFMCEIDDVAYEIGLAERVRVRVEHAGRVELSDNELKALSRSKIIHIIAVAFSCMLSVYLCGQTMAVFRSSEWDNTKEEPDPAFLMRIGLAWPFVAYWVAGVAEAVLSDLSGVDIAKQIAWVSAMRLASIVCAAPMVTFLFWGRFDDAIDADDISLTVAAFAARGLLNNTGTGTG